MSNVPVSHKHRRGMPLLRELYFRRNISRCFSVEYSCNECVTSFSCSLTNNNNNENTITMRQSCTFAYNSNDKKSVRVITDWRCWLCQTGYSNDPNSACSACQNKLGDLVYEYIMCACCHFLIRLGEECVKCAQLAIPPVDVPNKIV
jgi:hypothetical protein